MTYLFLFQNLPIYLISEMKRFRSSDFIIYVAPLFTYLQSQSKYAFYNYSHEKESKSKVP